MKPVRIHKEFVSPNGREKVELFGPRDGLYGFRVWKCQRKAWRRIRETCQLRSYARAVYEATGQTSWLASVLHAQSDPRLTYHLELLRGYAFRFALYDQERYIDIEYRCSACGNRISGTDSSASLHQGYVTRYCIPDDSGEWQWNWICEKCFCDRRVDLQWCVEA